MLIIFVALFNDRPATLYLFYFISFFFFDDSARLSLRFKIFHCSIENVINNHGWTHSVGNLPKTLPRVWKIYIYRRVKSCGPLMMFH